MKAKKLMIIGIVMLAATAGVWRLYAIGCSQTATNQYGDCSPPKCEYWTATVGINGTGPAYVFCATSSDPTDKCDKIAGNLTYDVITKYHYKATLISDPAPPRCGSFGVPTKTYLYLVPILNTVVCTDPPA